MASETETTVPMDDQAMFQSAVADEVPPAPPEPEQPQETTPEDRPRDEQGRFVAKEPEASPAEQQQAPTDVKQDEAGQVPSWRLREVREAREAAEKRANEAEQYRYAVEQQMTQLRNEMAQLRTPQKEPVDFFQNPEEAFLQRLTPLQEEIAQLRQETRLNNSNNLAMQTYGVAAVNEMNQAVAKAMRENNPEMQTLRAQLQASNDPVGMAVRWHKSQKLMELTGGDPDKYRNQILDEAIKDPKFQAKVLEAARATAGGAGQNGSRPNVQLPPSLNKMPGSGVSNADLSDNDMSDESLFSYAISNPGRR